MDRDKTRGKGTFKIPFPYYAPDDSLPPIPTAQDVENARTLKYNDREDRDRFSPTQEFRVSTVYLVKFSKDPDRIMQEAENLLFLQEHGIRAPKLYATFSDQEADPLDWASVGQKPPTLYYSVMDFIDGITMGPLEFEDLEPQIRSKLSVKMAEQLRLLRSIPAPNPQYYGRIHYQGIRHVSFTTYRDELQAGPFDTYEAFLQKVKDTFEANLCFGLNQEMSQKMKFYLHIFHDCFDKSSKSAEPKLTNLGMTFDNIVFAPSASNQSNRIEDYDVWLTDWEFMGWFPAWVQVASAAVHLSGGLDLLDRIEIAEGFKPYCYTEAKFFLECCGFFSTSI
ncbi:hypothetical protein K505DRAFT_237635 [Melanomma pulvis-pyrius CBS 109.77]|uniref:Aminoglycoside phosphotransferase domain-containing protein n=1 Tax=Melanomma pulvis-pyrius CBS 109.77 TaxID=1314802 RepID=A0A6A6XJ22_9PLEO|nr:hypothetical protein K505DRAFT_237635 [Melanomma pulvis-pyrius CBS 109.77]